MIKLPPPQMEGGKPLMQALNERHSTREFSDKQLTTQVLGNLLWAAAGVNRPESGKRTAPSARDWREIDIYVATAEAVYRYDNQKHLLLPVHSGDLRAVTGVQDFVATAPVNLVYIADLGRMQGADKDQRISIQPRTPDSSRRMFIYSVLPKVWLQWYGVLSTDRHLARRLV